ncbi:rhodanese-like domain-containing protein [Xanthobacter sp. V4C-4]|uniref:sulfurtransferase n=1 Tax=Xanthobacter cornucopiae TaxID=3119924 RepID=UPI00372C4BB1
MPKHFPLVSTDWLSDHLEDDGIVILDASVYLEPASREGERAEFRSGLDEYERQGHIPGARFADLFTQFSDPQAPYPFTRPTAAQFAAAAGRLGITRNAHVIVYDNLTNQWAARLWWVFRSYGHARVSVLDGGLRKYRGEGRRIEAGLSPYVKSSYPVPLPVNIVATTRDVLDLTEGRRAGQLICLLQEDDFTGRISARARPGHIPGSANLPFVTLLNEQDNTLRAAPELRARFQARTALGGELVVTYCGGGVASALGALALAVIGYDATLEYDGSLAEWTADPARPLELGEA